MASATLLVSAVVHVSAGAAFLVVGRALSRKPVGVTDRMAAHAFVAWWTALGLYMLLQAGLAVVASFGGASLTLFLAARAVTIPLLMVSVWGIAFHVLYVFTGRPGLNFVVASFYAICGALFYVVTIVERPTQVEVKAWIVELTRPEGTPLLDLLYVAIGLPPLLASLAYATLFVRVQTPIQKYRVALVSGSILAWIGSGLAARVAHGDFWTFFTLVVLGLGAAATVLLAYFPPPRLRLRLDPGDAEARERQERARRVAEEERARLAERVRALV